MRILVLNDIHISDKPPIGRTSSYTEDIFRKLEECRELAQSCDATILSGDMFHQKRPQFVSHRLVQRLIALFDGWPHVPYSIVGNHDLSEEGIASIAKQPIGVLFESGVLNWLDTDIMAKIDGYWVQLSPANYVDDIDKRRSAYSLERFPDAELAIKVAHGAVVKPGADYPFDCTPMDEIDTEGMDICLFGHLHWETGVRLVNGCWFAGMGSLARVSRHDIDRKPRVLVIDTDGHDLSKSSFKVKTLTSTTPKDQAFLPIEEIIISTDDSIRSYAAQLSSSIQKSDDGRSLDELMEGIDTKNVSPEVIREARRYLSQAGF